MVQVAVLHQAVGFLPCHNDMIQQGNVQRRQDALDDALQAATGLDEASSAEASSVEACSRRERPDFGERMLSVFPKMYPFEIDEMGECVRIDLKDIGNLPVAYWSLAGNPFLLRGYYCYRHLIFACIGRQEYAVGVPGIYSEENSKWAKECRMLRFQPLSKVKDRHGAFGYWLIAVHAQE